MSVDAVPAASAILLRDAEALEVLMIARHADIAFGGGALVFPGGRVEASDCADWSARAGAANFSEPFPGARIAAIREAFEEAGVLLARGASGETVNDRVIAALDAKRAEIENDDALFATAIADASLELATDALTLYAHWLTPPGLPKRFDTAFFIARAPDGQALKEDGIEATEAVWIAPEAALDAARRGARKIMFPTARILERLARCASIEAAFADACAFPVRAIAPQMVTRPDGRFLTIPDDLGYPVTEEPLATAMRG